MPLQPCRNLIGRVTDADRQDVQPLVMERAMKRLDLRGQLPRADRSPRRPEVQENGLSFESRQRLASAIEPCQREARWVTPPGSDRQRAKKRIELFGRDGMRRQREQSNGTRHERRDYRTAPWGNAPATANPFCEHFEGVSCVILLIFRLTRLGVVLRIRHAVTIRERPLLGHVVRRGCRKNRDSKFQQAGGSPAGARYGSGALGYPPRGGADRGSSLSAERSPKGGISLFPRSLRSDP
jgi:hypothetical protein